MVDNKVPLKGRAGLTARMSWHDKLFFLLSLVFTPIAIYMIYSSFPAFFSNSATVFNICAAPLPDFLSIEPIPTDHPLLLKAIESFENDLQTVFSDNNLDSLSVAIVTPRQPIFEWFRGPLQANDTQSQAQVDRHSIYRIASVSKLFTAMETLILRNRGALNLYGPVFFLQYFFETILTMFLMPKFVSEMTWCPTISQNWHTLSSTEVI